MEQHQIRSGGRGGKRRGEIKRRKRRRTRIKKRRRNTSHSAHIFCRHSPVYKKVAAVDVACLALQKVSQGKAWFGARRQLAAVAVSHDQVHAARIPLLETQQCLGEASVACQFFESRVMLESAAAVLCHTVACRGMHGVQVCDCSRGVTSCPHTWDT